MLDFKNRLKGGILGTCVGDAIWVFPLNLKAVHILGKTL